MVMPPDQFRKVSEEAADGISPLEHRVFIRHFYAGSTQCVADRQGRLVLPDDYCRDLKFGSDVILVGTHETFEIWNSDKWKETQDREAETYERVAGLRGL